MIGPRPPVNFQKHWNPPTVFLSEWTAGERFAINLRFSAVIKCLISHQLLHLPQVNATSPVVQTCCNVEIMRSCLCTCGFTGVLTLLWSIMSSVFTEHYTLALSCVYIHYFFYWVMGWIQTLISWGKSSFANMSSQELSAHSGEDMLLKGEGDRSYPESL